MEQHVVGVPHSPGGSEVDDAGLGNMAEIGSRNQPNRCRDPPSAFLLLGGVDLWRARGGW